MGGGDPESEWVGVGDPWVEEVGVREVWMGVRGREAECMMVL